MVAAYPGYDAYTKAQIWQWAITYGPIAPYGITIWIPLRGNTNHYMGTRDETIAALWTDAGYKELARIVGLSDVDPPVDWFIQKTLVDYYAIDLFSANGLAGSGKSTYLGTTIPELLAYKRRSYSGDAGEFHENDAVFDEPLPMEAIQRLIIDGGFSYYAMKVHGGVQDALYGYGAPYYNVPELGSIRRGFLYEISFGSPDLAYLNNGDAQFLPYTVGDNTAYIGHMHLDRPTYQGTVPFGDIYFGPEKTEELQQARQDVDPDNVFGSCFLSKVSP